MFHLNTFYSHFLSTNSHSEALKTEILSPYAARIVITLPEDKVIAAWRAKLHCTVFPHCTWHTQINSSAHTAHWLHLATSSNTAETCISDSPPPPGSSVLTVYAHQPVNCKSLATHVMKLPEGAAAGSLHQTGWLVVWIGVVHQALWPPFFCLLIAYQTSWAPDT